MLLSIRLFQHIQQWFSRPCTRTLSFQLLSSIAKSLTRTRHPFSVCLAASQAACGVCCAPAPQPPCWKECRFGGVGSRLGKPSSKDSLDNHTCALRMMHEVKSFAGWRPKWTHHYVWLLTDISWTWFVSSEDFWVIPCKLVLTFQTKKLVKSKLPGQPQVTESKLFSTLLTWDASFHQWFPKSCMSFRQVIYY